MVLSPLLQHFVDVGFQIAEEQFKEGNEVCPQITLLAEDEEGITFVPIVSMVDILGGKAKSGVVQELIRYAWEEALTKRGDLKLLAITVMADTWMKVIPRAELKAQLSQGTFKPPSQAVGSTEVIIVQLTLEKEDALYQWPYVRSGSEVVFSGKPEKNGEVNSFIKGLWPL